MNTYNLTNIRTYYSYEMTSVWPLIEAIEDARGGRLYAAGPVIAGVEGRFELISVDCTTFFVSVLRCPETSGTAPFGRCLAVG